MFVLKKNSSHCQVFSSINRKYKNLIEEKKIVINLRIVYLKNTHERQFTQMA